MLMQANGEPSTVDHFFDKLLKLPATMATQTGLALAAERADFLYAFLTRLAHELGDVNPLSTRLEIFGTSLEELA